jgi:hypothetical protein
MSFYGLVLVLVVLIASIYFSTVVTELSYLNAIGSVYVEVAKFIRAAII